MADENRMITFNYAKNNWDAYKKQTIPDTLECMTKADINNYLKADMTVVSSYLDDQLIPRSKFVGINPIIIDTLCGKTYIKGINVGSGETHNFSVKGSGRFLFYYYPGYNRKDDIYITDLTEGYDIFSYSMGSPGSVVKLINKTSTDERFYTLGVSKTSGPSNQKASYFISCAIQDYDVMTFPQRIFLFQRDSNIACRDFLHAIFGVQLTGFPVSLNFINPASAPINFYNTAGTAAHPESDGNFTWFSGSLNLISGSLPTVGTIIPNYSVNITINGVTKTFNFDVEVVSGSQ